jgi:hypothetical protein
MLICCALALRFLNAFARASFGRSASYEDRKERYPSFVKGAL